MQGLKGCDSVNPDYVHILVECLPKYFVSYISGMIKSKSSRISWKEFLHLKEWCGEHLRAQSCYHGSVGNGWDVVEKYISAHNTTSIIGDNPEKTLYTGIGHLSGVYRGLHIG